MTIYPPAFNISKSLRDGLVELIEQSTALTDNFTVNGTFKAYKTSFLDEFISNTPALAVFDVTDIEYKQTQPYIIEAYEKFYIQVACESADWWDAKDQSSELALGVRNAIRNYKNTNLDINTIAKDITIKNIQALEAKNERMWLYIVNIEIEIRYEEGSFPDAS